MSTKQGYAFAFNDQLPTVYQAVSQIVYVSPGGSPNKETQLRKNAIHRFAVQLQALWCKAFTEEHVLTINAIKNNLRKHINSYYCKVTTCKTNARLAQ